MDVFVKWIWASLVISIVLIIGGVWGIHVAIRDDNPWQGFVMGVAVVVGVYCLIVSGSVFVR